MFVLTINTGSSSVRLAVYEDAADGALRAGPAARYDSDRTDPRERLAAFLGTPRGARGCTGVCA